MNRLTLLRHAKSSWGHPELSDSLRPLNERGVRDAALMGGVCGDTLPPPDLVLVSSALRTRETIDLFLEGWGLTDTRVIVEEDLYLAGIADWRSVVSQWADEADHILGCAHQPGLGDFAGWLDSSCTQEVPTAAVFSFSITGGELKRSCGRMDLYRIPRDFR